MNSRRDLHPGKEICIVMVTRFVIDSIVSWPRFFVLGRGRGGDGDPATCNATISEAYGDFGESRVLRVSRFALLGLPYSCPCGGEYFSRGADWLISRCLH